MFSVLSLPNADTAGLLPPKANDPLSFVVPALVEPKPGKAVACFGASFTSVAAAGWLSLAPKEKVETGLLDAAAGVVIGFAPKEKDGPADEVAAKLNDAPLEIGLTSAFAVLSSASTVAFTSTSLLTALPKSREGAEFAVTATGADTPKEKPVVAGFDEDSPEAPNEKLLEVENPFDCLLNSVSSLPRRFLDKFSSSPSSFLSI